MENTIYDDKNGLRYERQGDYFLPCLELSGQEERSIGVWGQRHLRYLKEYRMVTSYAEICRLLFSMQERCRTENRGTDGT